MKHRTGAFFTAVSLVATIAIAGCGNGAGENAGPSGQPGGEATSGSSSAGTKQGYSLPIVQDGSVSLTFGGFDSWYPAASYTMNLPVWQEIEKKTGVKIDFQVVPADQYDAKMQTQIAAGSDLPDIMELTPTWTNAGVYRLAQQDVIRPLDDLIEQYAPDIKQFFEARPDIKKLLTAPDGKIYSIADLPLQQVPSPFFIRQDWLDKLGLSAPSTPDQWIEVLTAFKDKDPNNNGKQDEIPLVLRPGGYTYFGSAFGMQSPVQPFWADGSGKVEYQFLSPKFKELLAFTHDLYAKGLLDKEMNRDESNFNALVSTNVVGASPTVLDYLLQQDSILKSAGVADANTVALKAPQSASGQSGNYMMRSPLWSHYGIPTKSKYPEIAMKWINYAWISEEGNLYKDYGVEGQSFTMGADGPEYTDWVSNNPDKLDSMSALRSLGAAPSILVKDSLDVFKQKYAGTKVEQFMFLADDLLQPFPSPIPLEEESEVINQIMPDINTYVDEMIVKFIFGKEPIDNFDKFVQKVESMGIDNVVQVVQAQYDRYSQ